MTNHKPNKPITSDDLSFQEQMKGVKKLKQDKIQHKQIPSSLVKREQLSFHRTQNEGFYFSDEYQPLIDYEPVRYFRDSEASVELKKLKRGFYLPELFLDLHGLTQSETKKELAAVIAACKSEHIHCISILYGHGKNILKRHVPMWLAQHPAVICFHEAPKRHGGNAGLLVLVQLD